MYSWLLGTEVNQLALHGGKTHNRNDSVSSVISNKSTFDDTSSVSSHTNNTYYQKYSHEITLKALETIFRQSYNQNTTDIRPYRILTSLLDKPEIATDILDTILFDVFRALYLTCKKYISEESTGDEIDKRAVRKNVLLNKCQDLIKHANLLFNTLETYYIWQFIGDLFEKSIGVKRDVLVGDVGAGAAGMVELCLVTDLLLDIIPIESYAHSSSEILPNLFSKIIGLVDENLRILTVNDIVYSLKLCSNILTKIQPISVKDVKLDDSLDKSKSSTDLTNLEDDSLSLSEVKDYSLPNNFDNELKANLQLEKSKSDSKLNENDPQDDRERSNSNQIFTKRFQIRSPKLKGKNKKSKSSSKLFEFHHLVHDVKLAITPPEIEKEIPLAAKTNIENKFIIKCLNLYKSFFTNLIEQIYSKINLLDFYNKFLIKHTVAKQTMKQLEFLLNEIQYDKNNQNSYHIYKLTEEFVLPTFMIGEYAEAICTAAMMLVEFAAFPNILEQITDHVDDDDLPLWFKYLAVITCLSYEDSTNVQLCCMKTCLDILSLSKSMNDQVNLNEQSTTQPVLMGILKWEYLAFIETTTAIIEVSIPPHTILSLHKYIIDK